jgi:hypothetical protein
VNSRGEVPIKVISLDKIPVDIRVCTSLYPDIPSPPSEAASILNIPRRGRHGKVKETLPGGKTPYHHR